MGEFEFAFSAVITSLNQYSIYVHKVNYIKLQNSLNLEKEINCNLLLEGGGGAFAS